MLTCIIVVTIIIITNKEFIHYYTYYNITRFALTARFDYIIKLPIVIIYYYININIGI